MARVQCQANLRQIGLALNAYHADHSCFPPGVVIGYSPHAMLLPYLGEVPSYNGLNFDLWRPFGKLQNSTIAGQTLRAFLCPADVQPPWGGWTNYAVNTGNGVARNGWNGVFHGLGGMRVSEVVDGTSTTAAASEWVRGPGTPGSQPDALAHVFRTFPGLFNSSQFDQFVRLCRSVQVPGGPIASDEKGQHWIEAGYPHTWYHHVLAPNEHSCQNASEYDYGAVTASSRHGHGVNVLMVDGSARFVSDSVDVEVWRAIGSRNGSEELESF